MRKTIRQAFLSIATLSSLALTIPAGAQTDFSKVEIKTTALENGIFMLTGAGGNIGVSIGEDGIFLIDDQFAPLSKKIMAAINELSDKPVRYVLNTHWHGDHTGGNENFGKTGAVVVAHRNVRERMSTKQFMKAFGREVPPSPNAALPVVTFSNDVSFYFNGHHIRVMHRPAAHTDGDSVVYFTEPNVLHMGDTFFNGFFPFIDQSSGGSVTGIVKAAQSAIAMINDETRIIPGHGPIATKADLVAYQDMLQNVLAAIRPLIKAGQTREQVLAANPLAEIGKTWGNGFMKTGVFTGIVYDLETNSQ
ncbi:MAG: MBL fold metallo-hydrolase [Burkholderiaceae bacterium]